MNKTATPPAKVAPKPIPFGPEDKQPQAPEVKKNSAPAPLFTLKRDFGVPQRIRAFKGESKYPIKELNVHDAITGPENVVRGAAVAARAFRKKNVNHRFSMYKLEDGSYALVRTA